MCRLYEYLLNFSYISGNFAPSCYLSLTDIFIFRESGSFHHSTWPRTICFHIMWSIDITINQPQDVVFVWYIIYRILKAFMKKAEGYLSFPWIQNKAFNLDMQEFVFHHRHIISKQFLQHFTSRKSLCMQSLRSSGRTVYFVV